MEPAVLAVTHDLEARLVAAPRDANDRSALIVVELAEKQAALFRCQAREARPGRQAEAQHGEIGGRPTVEPGRDPRRDTREGIADILVIDPQIPVVVAPADGDERRVIGVVAHIVVVTGENPVVPVHDDIAFVLGRHDDVVDDGVGVELGARGRRETRAFPQAGREEARHALVNGQGVREAHRRQCQR